MKERNNDEYTLARQAMDELWPLTRSITGPGLEESLNWFRQHMPLEVEKVPSGASVFDWTVPPEWHFRSARLTGPDGEVVCDAADLNLHVVNYSCAVDRHLTLQELQPHLHSLPGLPEAVPYVTSYYKETWGFCLPDRVRQSLKEGVYHAHIDAEFVDGGVPVAQCVLPGESDREVLLTSYLCHPSMANNELSGPIALLLLYRRLSSWKKRRYTYRFLLNPETIGALCYLHLYHQHLREHLVSGLVLTCLGGPSGTLRYKQSFSGQSLHDQVMEEAAEGRVDIGVPLQIMPFTPNWGSDERQYGSPGFRFPVAQVARTLYGAYKGYHNSLDDKEFMNLPNLIESVDSIERLLQYGEVCGNPVNLAPFGEPQLGKRNLYPNMNAGSTRTHSGDDVMDGRAQLNCIMTTLNLADGQHSLFDIAQACGCAIDRLIPIINRLEDEGLIAYGREMPTL